MSSQRFLLRLTAIGVAGALIVGACSDDDSSTDTTDTTVAVTETTGAAEETTTSVGLEGEGLAVGVLAIATAEVFDEPSPIWRTMETIVAELSH